MGNFAQDGERQSIMEARFCQWIKNKKVIATYLTILIFFLIIASYKFAILTFFYIKSELQV